MVCMHVTATRAIHAYSRPCMCAGGLYPALPGSSMQDSMHTAIAAMVACSGSMPATRLKPPRMPRTDVGLIQREHLANSSQSLFDSRGMNDLRSVLLERIERGLHRIVQRIHDGGVGQHLQTKGEGGNEG